MRRAGFELCLVSTVIAFACVGLSLLAVPPPGEAVTIARPCKAEPTDDVVSYGDAVTCSIGVVGDSDTFRFSGRVDDKILIPINRDTGGLVPCLELFGPGGGGAIASACSQSASNRLGATLTQTGTYNLLVRDRNVNATGTYTFSLQRIFPLTPFGTAISYGETLVDQTIDLVGDLKFFVLTGTAANRISVDVVRTAGGLVPCLEFYGPDGGSVSSACSQSASNRFDVTLTQTGTHTVLVRDRNINATGTYTLTLQCLVGSCTDAIPTVLDASVSPPTVSVPVGTPATTVATITNAGAPADDGDEMPAVAGGPDALGCTIVPLSGPTLPFSYQPLTPGTLQPVGSPNTPFNLVPGTSQPFLITLVPAGDLCPTQFTFGFQCSNAGLADTLTGINTLLLSAGSQTGCGLRTTATVNRPTIGAGQTAIAGGSATSVGVPGTAADFYVGIVRPDAAIEFLTPGGIVVGSAGDVSSFRPLAVNVPLTVPFSVSRSDLFTRPRIPGDPHGTYVFFVAAVKTGALAGGTIPPDQVLSVATAGFTFP